MRLATYSLTSNDGADFVHQVPDGFRTPAAQAAEIDIRQRIRLVLHPPRPERRLPERRHEQRQPFPYPVHLTPLTKTDEPLVDETMIVIGRSLSEMGFDFYHVQPLPYRRVIASFETPNGQWIGLLMDLSWCRFGRHGFYDGGGRFLQSVTSPLRT